MRSSEFGVHRFFGKNNLDIWFGAIFVLNFESTNKSHDTLQSLLLCGVGQILDSVFIEILSKV